MVDGAEAFDLEPHHPERRLGFCELLRGDGQGFAVAGVAQLAVQVAQFQLGCLQRQLELVVQPLSLLELSVDLLQFLVDVVDLGPELLGVFSGT